MTSAFALVTRQRPGPAIKKKLLKRLMASSVLAEVGTECYTAKVWGVRACNPPNGSATSGKTKVFQEEA